MTHALFCVMSMLRSDLQNHSASCHTFGIVGKLSMRRDALTWFEFGLRLFQAMMWEVIDHYSQWKLNKIESCIGIWVVFLVLLESPRWVRFNRVYFTIFRAKVWKVLMFLVKFVAKNSNKLQKLGLEEKNQLNPSVFTLGPKA